MKTSVEGIVVRLDDVCSLSPPLERVWDTLEAHGVPVHLQVVPTDIDREEARRLTDRAKRCGVHVAVHQHGFRHVNHGSDDRPSEFGDNRSKKDQQSDILRGRSMLEELCPQLFEPIFSPPWDRCGHSTLEVLVAAGFRAVSIRRRPATPRHPALALVPMTTDPVDWSEREHRPWEQTRQELLATLERDGLAGLELHHEIMDNVDTEGLSGMIADLSRLGVRWPTMSDVAEGVRS